MVSRKPVILDSRGNPIPGKPSPAVSVGARPAGVRAFYDVAQTTDENRRHWANADSMSAKYANSRDVRQRLRIRSRYETSNNSYGSGIVDTLANDCVGTGPRLQMQTKNPKVNRTIEQGFMSWANSPVVRFTDKLQCMRRARAVDGEAFAMFVTNPRIMGPVQLDIHLIEADQVSSPWLNPVDPKAVDGIHYDDHGNPAWYDILRQHPGDAYQTGYIADPVDARNMIHWFRLTRPGQCRGIPDILSALPLFAQLRRYTLAVIAAAETAADLAAVVQSELPPDSESQSDCEPWETLDIERRMMMTLPAGWKMSQFRAEQPATTYEMFKHEILNEIARCVHMPYNIAAGNSSSYNYSSGRLDHQTYYKSLRIDQASMELIILDQILQQWIDEAWLATDWIPGGPDPLEGWPHQWFWDGHEHIDPVKEAQATDIRLKNHTTTYADEYAKRGDDYEIKLRQIAKEQDLLEELNITLPGATPALPAPSQEGDPNYQPNEPERVPQDDS